MKLYLSSYQIGMEPERLSELFGSGRRIGVIRNALDFSEDQERLERRRQDEFSQLEDLNLVPEDIDLRAYFDNNDELQSVIQELDGLWVTGGNAFILRRAMKQSGLDKILRNKSSQEPFVYAGYSAGACVVTPTLDGIHLVDPPDSVPPGYASELVWEGVGLVPFCIAPHYRSEHPESELIEQCVEYFMDHKIPFIVLRDGEAYVGDTSSSHNNE
jgi:dipeptidase E